MRPICACRHVLTGYEPLLATLLDMMRPGMMAVSAGALAALAAATASCGGMCVLLFCQSIDPRTNLSRETSK